MKFTFIFLVLISINAFASTSRFDCKYLNYYLELQISGFEHISHELKINGKVPVKELSKQQWFIETVTCQPRGFVIVASHAQYNDHTKQNFILTYSVKQGYKLSKAL